MTASVPLHVHPMGRMIFIRCEGAPPTHEAADAAANAWLEELAPPPLAERALAWERRHPLSVAIVDRREVPGVDELFLGKAGVEEVAAFRRATHAISVAGTCDPTGDGWLAVGSYARGVARAFDGLVVDHLTCDLRPLDERTTPLAEVTLTEISGTMSIPMGTNRWLFLTHGLGNLGIPEVFFPEVPGTQVATAITVIQALREALATRAAAHVRARGLDGFTVGPIEVPGFGPVAVERAQHTAFDAGGLRAYVPGRRSVALGRLLSGRARHAVVVGQTGSMSVREKSSPT